MNRQACGVLEYVSRVMNQDVVYRVMSGVDEQGFVVSGRLT